MVLSNFLSRQKTDNSNPQELMCFTLKSLSCEHFYWFNSMTRTSETETNKYLIQTRFQAKSSGIKVLEIHGVNKRTKFSCQARKTKTITITTYT